MGTFTKALTNLLCFGNFVGSDCTAYEEKYEKMFANLFIVLKAAEIVNRPVCIQIQKVLIVTLVCQGITKLTVF